ncbi:MAG: hypothetical protein ACOZNI_25750 [Myxococcota bacterium]
MITSALVALSLAAEPAPVGTPAGPAPVAPTQPPTGATAPPPPSGTAKPPPCEARAIDLDGNGKDSIVSGSFPLGQFGTVAQWIDPARDAVIVLAPPKGAIEVGPGSICLGGDVVAALDANKDGLLDAKDPGANRLRVWKDTNRDGRVTDPELAPLPGALDPRASVVRAAAGDQRVLPVAVTPSAPAPKL